MVVLSTCAGSSILGFGRFCLGPPIEKALVSYNGGFLLLVLEVCVFKLSEAQLAFQELQHIF